MTLKEQLAINSLMSIQKQVEHTLKLVNDEKNLESLKQTMDQLRIDLVDSNMKLSKIKQICEDPNTDDYFALGQIMDIVGTKP